jgi:hypothetical protein
MPCLDGDEESSIFFGDPVLGFVKIRSSDRKRLVLNRKVLNFFLWMDAAVLRPDRWLKFKLAKKEQVSHNAVKLHFALPTPKSVLGLPIGQHISCMYVTHQCLFLICAISCELLYLSYEIEIADSCTVKNADCSDKPDVSATIVCLAFFQYFTAISLY